MSLYARFQRPGPSGFGYGSTTDEVCRGLDLKGRRIVLTGSNSGLGLETLRVLTHHGATVLAAARTKAKAEDACAGFGENAVPVVCELSDPASVRSCVEDVSGRGGVDAIICNAGIMALPKLEQCFGIEKQFFTNHVGHFMLVTGLLPSLSSTGRVVMVSSAAHRAAPSAGVELDNLSGERGYSGWTAYGQSKIANLLFARHLATRFGDSGQTANALHPGVIYTNLARHMNPLVRAAWAIGKPLFLKTIPQGAATQVYLAVHPDGSKTNGEYFSDCNVAESRRRGRDAQLAARLWEKTEEIVASLP